MKRSIISLSVAFIMVLATTSLSFASESQNIEAKNDKKIEKEVTEVVDEVNQAKKNDEFTSKEEKEIINNHSTEAMNKYKELVIEEAMEAIDNTPVSLESNEEYSAKTINLDSGGSVIIEMSDLPEGEVSQISSGASKASTRAASGSAGMKVTDHKIYRSSYYKKNGNRYFTSKYTVGYLRGTISLTVENHYTISSKGLKERYGAKKVGLEALPTSTGFTVRDSNTKVTDWTASKNGEDINIAGWVTFSIGTHSGEKTLELDTRVKLIKKTAKGANVTEHVYISKNFF